MCSEVSNVKKILVCGTGSVAAIKIPEIIIGLKQTLKTNVQIRFVPTGKAMHFLPNLKDQVQKEFELEIFMDEDEWLSWRERGDPVLHIELRKWADLAWDFEKPILFAPAMNTFMWDHPITTTQIGTLKSWGYEEIPPIEKILMCKDKGVGAMAEPETIVQRIVAALSRS